MATILLSPPVFVCMFACNVCVYMSLLCVCVSACRQRYEDEIRGLRDEVDVLTSQAAAVRKLEDAVKRYRESLEAMDALKEKNRVSETCCC